MRVALLSREFPPEVYGGAGVAVEYLARELAGLVDVHVHCFGADRPVPPGLAELHAHRPWERLAGHAPHVAALQALSVDIDMAAGLDRADLVHSNTWYTNFAGYLAQLLYRIPHVMTVHSMEPLRPWKEEQLGGGYRLSSFCEQVAIESADAVVAVSRAVGEDILRCYPAIDPGRVVAIPHGVDPDEYRPSPGTSVLDRHGLDARAPLVVFVGRISRQKGISHLLEASTRFDPRVQLAIRAGAADTPELEREVREHIDRAGAQGRTIAWLREPLERPELVQLLSRATVACFPSVYEPFGLVNVEAMACAVPVVASAVGGIPEIVDDGVTGILVPLDATGAGIAEPRDPEAFGAALAAAVNELVDDPGRARSMGDAGRERVLTHFTWEVAAHRTVELYERLVAGRPSPVLPRDA